MLWENGWQVFSLVVPLSIKALCRGSFARQSSIFCSVVLSCSQDSLSVFQTPRIIKSAGEMGWLFLLCLFPSLKYQHPNSSLSFPAPRSAIQCGTKASDERFQTAATTIKALKEVNTESVRLCHILPVTTKRTLCPQMKTEERCPSGL